ncbi:hypothetical protein JA1_004844 [Spathaspora sp. JA1]|nr:hypothetical protein JA1_004844 [Spathaspora sp. JA1]
MGDHIPNFDPSHGLQPSGDSSGDSPEATITPMQLDEYGSSEAATPISQSIENAAGSLDNKPKKRQRRSYSCGPCKLLKIKCDLQIPCSSCKKFKRINRCLLQPPQPPSREELGKIKERKKRSNIKKLKFNTSNPVSIPSMVTSSILSATTVTTVPTSEVSNESSASPEKVHVLNKTIPKIIRQFNLNHISDQKNHHNQLQPEPRENSSQPAISFITSTFGLENGQKHHQNGVTNKNGTSTDLIQYLLVEDQSRMFELTIVEIKRIKRLLPNNFGIFETLFDLYMNSIAEILIDLQNHQEMKIQAKLVYEKLLKIDDEDPKNLSKTIEFTIIELRNLSIMFLIMANGLLFEINGLQNFLLERTAIFHPRQDILNDWIKISKTLKLKILSYETLTDLIYLLDWYFILKNYYGYNNMIIENYLEFNNLLNYIVLNNDFVDIIEDPSKESTPELEEANQEQEVHRQYPQTREFTLLAKYWIQIRWIEVEFTFFQFKGSLLVSNQLKNTLVPHKRLLNSLYGNNLPNSMTKFLLEILGICYKRSKNSMSQNRDIIKGYLELYANIFNVVRPGLIQFQTRNNSSITSKEVELLVKNQAVLVLFVRWLSFIRIESNYFPSLRYTSYLTTMLNMFNHFNLLDDLWNRQHNQPGGIIQAILDNYSVYYIKAFYQALVYQGIFLIILRHSIKQKNSKFKLQLDKIYNIILNQFQITLNKFLNNPIIQSKLQIVEFFKLTTNLLLEFNQYLQQPTPELKNNENDSTELLFDLKSHVSKPTWEILVNYYFGSKDNFIRYSEKVCELFAFLKVEEQQQEGEIIPITSKIQLNDELVNEYVGKLSGFEFDNDIVAEYLTTCVDPHMD